MNFPIPLHNEVILLRDDKDVMSSGGILQVHLNNHTITQGTIMSVGHKVTDIKAGEKVIFPKYGGKEFEYENVKYIIFKDNQLFGVIENDS